MYTLDALINSLNSFKSPCRNTFDKLAEHAEALHRDYPDIIVETDASMLAVLLGIHGAYVYFRCAFSLQEAVIEYGAAQQDKETKNWSCVSKERWNPSTPFGQTGCQIPSFMNSVLARRIESKLKDNEVLYFGRSL